MRGAVANGLPGGDVWVDVCEDEIHWPCFVRYAALIDGPVVIVAIITAGFSHQIGIQLFLKTRRGSSSAGAEIHICEIGDARAEVGFEDGDSEVGWGEGLEGIEAGGPEVGEGGLDPGAEERGEPAVGRDELGEFDVRGV